jgi:hypothetical protein
MEVGQMGKKLSIAALVAAMLMSGLLAGVSHGGSAAITQPTVIELHSGKNLKERPGGLREEALDTDGNRVGTISWTDALDAADWHVTIVYGLKGDSVERGTVVATGIFRGFNGESLAITGGTGAYVGVGGSVRLTVEKGEFTHTLKLIP